MICMFYFAFVLALLVILNESQTHVLVVIALVPC